ncbi:hypothetical protein RFI_24969, partial [Reticulomyxa filosa]
MQSADAVKSSSKFTINSNKDYLLTKFCKLLELTKLFIYAEESENFKKDISRRLQSIDGVNPLDIEALEEYCETLTIDEIKKQQKMKEQSTKNIVA